jgi:hypothetical protein
MGRYKLTPKRRQSILKAQKISARKRHVRPKDTVQYWVAKGIKKGGNAATFGAAGIIADVAEAHGVAKRRYLKRRG